MKVRAKSSGAKTTVKILARHPMESGLRKDKNGKAIPAHYIQDLSVKHKGNTVFVASLGPAVSKTLMFLSTLKELRPVMPLILPG